MHILHINSYFVGTNLYKNLYDNQISEGHDIKVYVPYCKGTTPEVEDMGSYSVKAEVFSSLDRAFFKRKHRLILNDIQKRINICEYDIMHAHSLFSNGYIAMMLKKKYGIPYIVAVRNADVNVFFAKMIHLRKLGVEIMKEASKVVFISEPYKKHVLQKYVPAHLHDEIAEKSSVIPNGIHRFWLDNAYCRADVPEGKVRILSVSDIDSNKNHLTSLKACSLLKSKGMDIEFNIVGKAVEPKILEELQKSDFVNYLGTMKKEELIDVYRANDIFVMPSFKETFGLVYAEAMSQGLPVIYTIGQGFDEQFEEGYAGYHVDPSDETEIANSIENILNDYSRISCGCTEGASKYNWAHISEIYTDMYTSCIESD